MGCKICKPKMMDCLSCPKNDNPKELFCFDKEDCSVPFAMVRDGKIIGWETKKKPTLTQKDMDYEKKYNEALKRAKAAIDIAADKDLVKGVATTIFPELRESEDERMMREFDAYLRDEIECYTNDCRDEEDRRKLAMLKYMQKWLEKQIESLHISESCKENPDSFTDEDERIRKELVAFFIEVRNREGNEGYWHDLKVADILSYLEKQKEQKSAWSEEDEKMRSRILDIFACDQKHYLNETAWLKSLPERFNLQTNQDGVICGDKVRVIVCKKED